MRNGSKLETQLEQSLKSDSLKQNQNLVNFFIKNFYTSVGCELEYLVSTSFRFSVDNGPDMDFEKYARRKSFMQEHIKFSIDPPTTEDDIFFTTRFNIAVPRVDQPVLYCGGELKLLVARNLIARITVNYEATGGDYSSIQQAIMEIRKIDNSVNFL